MLTSSARRKCGLAVLAVFLARGHAYAAAEPKQVLLIASFDQAQLVFGDLTENLRKGIVRGIQGPVNFIEFSLQPDGFPSGPDDESAQYLRAMFSGRRQPDLVVTFGGPAAEFAQRHRSNLFPQTPLLLAAVDQRFVQQSSLDSRTTAVAVANDFPRVVESILDVLPQTSNLFVVLGSSTLERTWREALTELTKPYEDRLTLEWTTESTFAGLRRRSASLPARSAILYVLFIRDAEGAAYTDEDIIRELRAAANAPLFGIQSTYLGRGVVGGPLMPLDEVGITAGAVALRILNGESPASITTPLFVPGAPVFDWRELRRWRISADRLPAGSTVLFREPTLWERHGTLLAVVIAVVVGQSALILAFVRGRAIRRRTEQSLRESEERFRLLAAAAPIMMWISGLDKGCTDFNPGWLTFTGRTLEQELGDGWAEGVHPDDLATCLDIYNGAFDRRESFRMEYRLRRHDGEYRWVLDCGVPRFMGDGAFAGFIGSAIDITELRDAHVLLSTLNRRLLDAQEQERERLARELHDDVGQRMMALLIMLNTVSDVPDTVRRRIDEATKLANEVGRDLQAISHGLHPEKLKLLGLAPAARGLCAESAAMQGVHIEFSSSPMPDPVSPEVALALFRVLQEALANAIKHSGSRTITVSLEQHGRTISLVVQDSGCGFEPEAALRSHGLGLISMQERLNLLGGSLVIESRRGTGTVVRAVAPVSVGSAVADSSDVATSGL